MVVVVVTSGVVKSTLNGVEIKNEWALMNRSKALNRSKGRKDFQVAKFRV